MGVGDKGIKMGVRKKIRGLKSKYMKVEETEVADGKMEGRIRG